MKKFRGKALAALLSLALIASSFPVTLASASSTQTGILADDPDQDEFWLVNGGTSTDARSVFNFDDYIYDGTAPLETKDHQSVSDVEVSSISHVSGDKLVKWDIDDDNNGATQLSLKKSDSEGTEVIAILYKGTYTDDDDNDITVKASANVTIHAVDKYATVIGDASDLTDVDDIEYAYDDDPLVGNDEIMVGNDTPELGADDDEDDNFATKTMSKDADTKQIAVFRAVPYYYNSSDEGNTNIFATWQVMSSIVKNSKNDPDETAGTTNNGSAAGLNKDDNKANDVYYVLKSSNDNVALTDGGTDYGSSADFSGEQTATTSQPGVALASSGTALTITDPTASEYTYKYATGDAAATQASDFTETVASDNKIVLTSADGGKYLSVAAFDDDGALVAGSIVSALYTYSETPTDCVLAPQTADTEKPGFGLDTSDGVTVTVTAITSSAYTYKYVIGDDAKTEATDFTTSVTGNSISLTSADDGKVVSIAYYEDGDFVDAVVTGTYTAPVADAAVSGVITATVANGSSSGNVTFTAEATDAIDEDGEDDSATIRDAVASDDDVKAKVKISKKIIVDTADTSVSVYDNDGTTYVKGNVTTTGEKINGNYIVDVEATSTAPTVTVSDDAKLDSVIGTVGTLTIGGAKVNTVDLDAGNVEIDDEDAKVGDITTDDGGDVSISADVSVGNIESDDGGIITVEAGKTGDITVDDGEVDITASEDETVVSTGTVTAKTISLTSDDGQISASKLVSSTGDSSDDDASITLEGDSITIDAIDFSYYATDLQFQDFQGTIPAPVGATGDGSLIETTDEDDDVTITGDLDATAVTIEDESEVVFNGKASIDSLDGSGTMYIGANKLYIGDDASGVLVKITDNTIKAGDTIFTAAADAVDDDDLDFFGFTVAKTEGSSTDTFKVDTLEFAGLMMNKTSDKVVLNNSTTYTATAYAPGTSIPEGYSIAFDMDDNSGVFELTDNGNGTATVKCVDFDETFSDENKATLVAYLVDEDGDEDDDYAEAECDLTALKTPEKTFVSDTNNDFTLPSGASYQFKITDASAAPVMTAGTAGIVDIANVGKSGNDYFIKVTAKGAANAKTGIYVNGTKLLVLTVGGVVCDTTKDITVKKGASYQYKVTASAAPTFGFGTAGVFTSQLVSHSGNNYFYKVTAVGAAGASTGVYVNGQKVNVAKVG